MKTIHNVVTFLAAVVILSWAGWQTYLHWDILSKGVVVKPVPAAKCPCCKSCKCGKTDCKGCCTDKTCCADKKCCDGCGCTDAGCCKK